jgi:hypothetical protein
LRCINSIHRADTTKVGRGRHDKQCAIGHFCPRW